MGAVGGLLRGLFSPSRLASGPCQEPSWVGGCHAHRVACRVAFDRRTIDPEAAGSLGLGDALLNRLDDLLLSEVKRICTHAFTISGAPSSQSAVRPQAWRAPSWQRPPAPPAFSSTLLPSSFHRGAGIGMLQVNVLTANPGKIRNRATVDPDNVVEESSETNNTQCLTTNSGLRK